MTVNLVKESVSYSVLHRFARQLFQLVDERFIKRDGHGGQRGAGIAGTVPLFGAGKQGELTHDQDLSVHIAQSQIHQPFFVAEDPHPGDFAGQPVHVLRGVIGRYAHQHQQTFADLPFYLTANADAGL